MGYSAFAVRHGRATLTFGMRTQYGYGQKIFWQLIGDVHGFVTLRGWNLQTHQPMWFGHPVLPHPESHYIAWATAIVREHRAPTLTFVPAAGCYALHALWNGGSWTIPFAAGRPTEGIWGSNLVRFR